MSIATLQMVAMPSPAEVRGQIDDVCAFVVPYALRSGAIGAILFVINKIFGANLPQFLLAGSPVHPQQAAPTEELMSVASEDTCSANMILKSNWAQVRHRLGWSPCQAIVVSFLRLLLFHWLQPGMYIIIFYGYSDLLDPLQLVLGFVVAVREALYFVITLLGLMVKPAFLLFSPTMADCHDRILYFAMPEKFVLNTCCPTRAIWVGLIVMMSVADLCGVLALVLGLVSHRMWPPLACGYTVTMLSLLPTMCYLLAALRQKPSLSQDTEAWRRRSEVVLAGQG